MSLLRIIRPRTVWRTRLRYRFDLHHRLSSSIEQSSSPSVHMIKRPVLYYADQYDTHILQCNRKMKIHMTKLCRVRNFSSSRKPLLFTDDLLQKYIRQIVAEWNQIQKQLTGDKSHSATQPARDYSNRLSLLDPIVSKVMQHHQYSANIAELEDIISGMCTFTFQLIISLLFFALQKCVISICCTVFPLIEAPGFY